MKRIKKKMRRLVAFVLSFNLVLCCVLCGVTAEEVLEVQSQEQDIEEAQAETGPVTIVSSTIQFLLEDASSQNAAVPAPTPEPIYYSVRFMGTEGRLLASIQVKEGEPIVKPATLNPPQVDGFAFVCWSDEATGQAFVFGTPATRNVTVKASYVEIEATKEVTEELVVPEEISQTYQDDNVTLESGLDTPAGDQESGTDTHTVKLLDSYGNMLVSFQVKDGLPIHAPIISVSGPDGYVFAYWADVATGAAFTFGSLADKDITLKTRYVTAEDAIDEHMAQQDETQDGNETKTDQESARILYSVKMLDSYGNILEVLQVEAGETLQSSSIAVPMMEGYAFAYWVDVATGNPFSFSKQIDHNITLKTCYVLVEASTDAYTAQEDADETTESGVTEQEPIVYTIRFLDSYGNVLITMYLEAGQETHDPGISVPEMEGYAFAFWANVGNGAPFTFGTAADQNITLKTCYVKLDEIMAEEPNTDENQADGSEGAENDTEDTANEDVFRAVRVVVVGGPVLTMGESVTLMGILDGFEDMNATFQWQSQTEGDEWADIPGAANQNYTFKLDDASAYLDYRLLVSVLE